MLEAYNWPRQARYQLSGHGTCVGATYDRSIPRMGFMTDVCHGLIKELNNVIKKALG